MYVCMYVCIYIYIYIYIYIWCYLYRLHIYRADYAINNINQSVKNPGSLVIPSLIRSNPLLYDRIGN